MTIKRALIILSIIAGILLIPLIAMQFTPEVNWDGFDFGVAAVILLTFGFLIDFLIRKLKKSKYRYFIIALVVICLMLLWVEMAVGVFGSPIAGD